MSSVTGLTDVSTDLLAVSVDVLSTTDCFCQTANLPLFLANAGIRPSEANFSQSQSTARILQRPEERLLVASPCNNMALLVLSPRRYPRKSYFGVCFVQVSLCTVCSSQTC